MTTPVTRRTVLAQAAALAATPALAAGSGSEMRDRTQRFIDMLDGAARKAALFDFDDAHRRTWNYMRGSAFSEGLPLERMSAPQKDAAYDILGTALSTNGLETAQNIMLQQDIMRDEWGKGSPDRNRERFSISIFGDPSPDAPWAWKWEGHHLTVSVTLIGDQVISVTPKAFSSEPNTVPSGPHKGLVVLENEALGRALYADLGSSARKAALLRERSYGNVRLRPWREDIGAPAGVALGDLPQVQADMVARLVALYTSDHLAGPMATAQQDRIATEDQAAIRFAWAGPNIDEESLYYRIHGATFLIEFATLFNQPQHHHTIVYDLAQNYGDHRLG